MYRYYSYYMLLQVTTGNPCYYRLIMVTTGYYRLLQVTTDYYRLLQITTGYYSFYSYLILLPVGFLHVGTYQLILVPISYINCQ